MLDAEYEVKGIMALPRNYFDSERVALRRLLWALPPEERRARRAEVERVWAAIRSKRNAEAQARARKGESSAGFMERRFPAYTTSLFVNERARMAPTGEEQKAER